MGMSTNEATREVVENTGDLNIHRGKVAAWKALCAYIQEGTRDSSELYVPDISDDDQRLDDVNLMSYNAIRSSWIATYVHWKYPDILVGVQCSQGSIYTQVSKQVTRYADHAQASLF